MPLRTAEAESEAFESVIVRVADREPEAVGVKATFKEQFAFAGRVVVQLLVSTVKSAGLVAAGILSPVMAAVVLSVKD